MTQYVMEETTALAAPSSSAIRDKTDLMAALRATPSREDGVMLSEIAVPSASCPHRERYHRAIVDYFQGGQPTVSTPAERTALTIMRPMRMPASVGLTASPSPASIIRSPRSRTARTALSRRAF
jgi:hypothetical protein